MVTTSPSLRLWCRTRLAFTTMPLVLFRSSMTQPSARRQDLAVVAADEAVVDLQVVVRRATDHRAPSMQRQFAHGLAVGGDDDAWPAAHPASVSPWWRSLGPT